MLQSDWLSNHTLSSFSVRWLKVVYETYSRFPEISKEHLEKKMIIKFFRTLKRRTFKVCLVAAKFAKLLLTSQETLPVLDWLVSIQIWYVFQRFQFRCRKVSFHVQFLLRVL